MAAIFLPLLLVAVLLPHSRAAILPDKASSAHGESGQEVTSHELDLADLKLPPEVITEALFSQTDLLQDQLEQCEEKVRNNLKGDDTAEIDGIEGNEDDDDYDDDDNDDSEDEDDGDELNRKIAELAVNAFSHSSKEDISKIFHLETPDSKDNANRNELSADAATNVTGDASSSLDEEGRAGDAGEKKGKASEAKEEEYVVYEYEDVGGDENVGDETGEKNEDRQKEDDPGKTREKKDEERREETDDAAVDEKKKEGGKDGSNTHENSNEQGEERQEESKEESDTQAPETHAADTPAVSTPSNQPEPETDTTDSDAEESQPQPDEVAISLTVTDNNSTDHDASGDTSNDVAEEEERAPRDQRSSKGTGTTSKTLDTETNILQDGPGNTTPKVELSESSGERPAKGEDKPEVGAGDNNSEESRIKRSLSLQQVVMQEVTQKNVRKVTLGKGRIRRQASPQETQTRLRNHQETAQAATHQDGIKMAAVSQTHDVIKMAEQFLQAYKAPSRSSGLTDDPSKSDGLDGRRFLATRRVSSWVERVRRRRSVLVPGLSPERYVPLIDQLVERLNYLQHSLRVCHMLLPAGHAPSASLTAV